MKTAEGSTTEAGRAEQTMLCEQQAATGPIPMVVCPPAFGADWHLPLPHSVSQQ